MICDDTNEVISEEKDGYHRFKFSNWLVFEQGASKHGSTAGKLFAIRLLEEMYKLGYDPIISSDLVRCFDNATIFFQKVSAERPACRVYCMAPGRSDTEFTRITKDAIIESWPRGIQNEDTKTVSSETVLQALLALMETTELLVKTEATVPKDLLVHPEHLVRLELQDLRVQSEMQEHQEL